MKAGETNSVVFEQLELIRQAHDGKLRPPDVVDAARPENSPLHSHFEWDDAAAAEEYRLNQARTMIRQVTVTFNNRKVPAYYNIQAVPVDQAPYYVDVARVSENKDEFMSALEQFQSKLKQIEKAIEDLKHIARSAKGESGDRLELLMLASEAFQAAASIVQRIH